MRIRRFRPAMLVASTVGCTLALPLPLHAQEVGTVGLESLDLEPAELAPVSQELEAALARHTPVRSQAATLDSLAADPAVAEALAQSKAGTEAGERALKAFVDLRAAQVTLDQALLAATAAHQERLEPEALLHLLDLRARLFFALRRPEEMGRALLRMMPLQASKRLDPRLFPPEAVASYGELLARARSAPPGWPDPGELSDIARRTGLHWVVGGRVQVADGTLSLALSAVSPAGRAETRLVHVPTRGELSEKLDAAAEDLLTAVGALKPGEPPPLLSSAAGVPHPDPLRLPPAHPFEEPVPVYRRWWFWGGVGAVVVAGVAAVALANQPQPSPAGPSTVTVVFDPHP